ncbi:unnamed protein product, partial [Vitis vinifera]
MAEEAKAKGNAAFSSGDFSAAVRHFSDAIALAPTNHVLYSNRSAAYASLQQYSEALADAKKTPAKEPEPEPEPMEIDFETAIQHYTKAIELDDEDISFITNRAAVYLEMGQVLCLVYFNVVFAFICYIVI